MTEAILFDLDGTLLDTAPEFAFIVNQILAQEGLPAVSVEKLRPSVSFGAEGIITCAFGFKAKDPYFYHIKQLFLTRYSEIIGSYTQFFPGMEAILSMLEQLGRPWAVVTNKPQIFTVPLLKKFPFLKDAPCVVSADTLAVSKPSPEPLLYACKQLNVNPTGCWYIGDALTDVQASHGAGMPCAVAHYGYIPSGINPLDWQANYYLNTASDIKALI